MESIEIQIEELKNNRRAVIDKIKMYQYTVIICKCIMCGSINKIEILTQNLIQWLSGRKLIQDALTDISKEERELLLSQICGKCWEGFKPDNE